MHEVLFSTDWSASVSLACSPAFRRNDSLITTFRLKPGLHVCSFMYVAFRRNDSLFTTFRLKAGLHANATLALQSVDLN